MFKEGVDMDDLLSSNPKHFRMLRVMQGVSFMKLDDKENKAVRDYILFRKKVDLINIHAHFQYDDSFRTDISSRLTDQHRIKVADIMDSCVKDDGSLSHEMVLECGVIEILARKTPQDELLGYWDYISHQVIAFSIQASSHQ
jgi:hypothetical protein